MIISLYTVSYLPEEIYICISRGTSGLNSPRTDSDHWKLGLNLQYIRPWFLKHQHIWASTVCSLGPLILVDFTFQRLPQADDASLDTWLRKAKSLLSIFHKLKQIWIKLFIWPWICGWLKNMRKILKFLSFHFLSIVFLKWNYVNDTNILFISSIVLSH